MEEDEAGRKTKGFSDLEDVAELVVFGERAANATGVTQRMLCEYGVKMCEEGE